MCIGLEVDIEEGRVVCLLVPPSQTHPQNPPLSQNRHVRRRVKKRRSREGMS